MPPNDKAACVIHNDYRFDNVVLDPANPFKVIGVITGNGDAGRPPDGFLGNTLAYWVEADDEAPFKAMRRQPTHLPGMLTRQDVIAYYGEKTGHSVENFDFYLIYGLFRLAVIIQRSTIAIITVRRAIRNSPNFGETAKYLEQRCLRLIDQSEI